MKIRRSIYWFTVVVAVLIMLALWFWKKPVEPTLVTSTEQTLMDSNRAVNEVQPPQATPSATTATTQAQSPIQKDKVELLKEILNANDADIVFYGRLEDQLSNGVDGAEVNFSIQFENASDRGIKRGQVMSDGNGLFTISGYKGANLGLMPKKPGYTLATTGTSFRYSQTSPGYFVPDINNPAVIKMWKLQGAEPLVNINQRYKLRYTNAPINVDLLADKIVPSGGDLKITVNRPAGVISGRNPQNWSIHFEVIDGGFIVTSWEEAHTTYLAPESGYESSGTFGNNNGIATLDQMFFVQSRNGQVYSKIQLLLGINDTPDGLMSITFSGVANANGSRNWEATAPQQ
jgi:hypothetical protein